MSVEIRRLGMRDLHDVEEIERRSYTTPWSRSMFAGEVTKPSSICLGAFDPDDGILLGYAIVSRYVDAWHVMNLAVAPEARRRGVARALLARLFEITGGEARRDATSGTTPPKRACRSACDETTFARISPAPVTSAAAVSSQEVSIPRITPRPPRSGSTRARASSLAGSAAATTPTTARTR